MHTLATKSTSSLIHSNLDHRDLHSFPTRRSSDLARREYQVDRHHVGHPPAPWYIRSCNAPGERTRRCRGTAPGSRPAGRRDRKSTRLNSSHVKISYAVFCLKKKKHQKRTQAYQLG